MRTLAILLAFFGLVTLPTILAPNDKMEVIGYTSPKIFGYRGAPPPSYYPGHVFNSDGGYIEEYRGLRSKLRHDHRLVRLGYCASACTMLLSLPNVCVYPTSRFLFHAARRYDPHNGPIDMDATMEMYGAVPRAARGLLRAPWDGLDQILTGAQMIMSGGARPCPY